MKLGMQVGLGPGHILLDRDPGPPPPKGRTPQFLAHICCGQMAQWIKMPLGVKVGLDPSDILLDGDPAAPPQKGGRAPQFSAHVYCGQAAAWIKMALGMEICLSSGHIVLDGDPAPLTKKGGTAPLNFRPMFVVAKRLNRSRCHLVTMVGLRPGNSVLDADPAPPLKEHRPPNFGPYLLGPNGWMDQDATWYEGRSRPRLYCVTWGHSSPSQKGHRPLGFRPMSVVVKRSPISATAEHLLWPPCTADADIIFCPVVSSIFLFFLFFFPRLISSVADWMYTVLPHMVWPERECKMQV